MARSATLKTMWESRALVWRLAMAQLKDRYAASALGALWAVIQPAMVMAVFWFVFVFGLRLPTHSGEAPFVATLLVGLAAWFWFNDSVTGGTYAVTGSAYLVKKIAFPLEILPLAPTASSFVIHVAVVVLIAAGLALAGELAGIRLLLLPYYMFALAVLGTALSYWAAALNVFHRDVSQTVTLLLQIWFWLTPIVWSFAQFPPEAAEWLSWNPLTYIVSGYRHALLADIQEAPALALGVSYWIVSLMLLWGGVALYRRLCSDFADVL